ncbi:MAG TPA: hypothetical protein VMA95_12565 [Streptosporangiaceae bacterium]|nr:hypothetical protein [Streptosporangiaceae bacterium]
MKTKTTLGYLATLVAGIALGLTVIGTAVASPAGAKPARTATHHYTLAASAFAPDGLHDTADDYFNQWDPAELSNQDSGRCFNTGLSLPTGATLKGVTVYYSAGTDVMFFELNRQDLIDHTAIEMVSFDTAAGTGSTPTYTSTYKRIPSQYGAVNMTGYAYSVGVCPLGNTTFSGLSITYTVPVS